MKTFDGIHPDEQIVATEDAGFAYDSGKSVNGKLVLTQKRLVFVKTEGMFSSKTETVHAIDLNTIQSVSMEPAQSLGVYLRIEFASFEDQGVVWYNGRINQMKKFSDMLNSIIHTGL